MQQFSSLPEHNPKIDVMSEILPTTPQIRDNLWMESNLNRLQNRFNNLLASANTLPQVISTEVEILQTFVNEIANALNTECLGFRHCDVGIVECQPQEKVGKICYVSSTLNRGKISLEKISKPDQNTSPKLHTVITVEDLQKIELQELPTAWRLINDSSDVMLWLIIYTQNCDFNDVSNSDLLNPLRSQFIQRAIDCFNQTLSQLKQIQFWQQRCQKLTNLNQELERSSQFKNQFLANTSHEIRTPLSSIIGFTQLLLAQGYEPERERHQEYLNIIKSSGKHLLDLINDILDLSKIEANQLEIQLEIIDIQTLCNNVLTLVKEKAANKGLKLKFEINDDVTNLIADPLRLKQMLLNLLFNAVKFTNSGTVGLRVEKEDLNLKFIIWDTGIGISQENQSLLFRPYSQILNPGVDKNEGTGLGLMVTKQLAEIHGGYLELESEANQGSSFTIFLPMQPTGKVLEAIEEKAEEDLKWQEENSHLSDHTSGNYITKHSSENILLVEDDFANCELMRIYLNRLGYQVNCVKNGEEMWDILTQINPKVILIDVTLPDENGLKLVKQLRQHPQYHNISLIAQTAMAMKGDRENCLAAGCNDYISKPIDLEILGGMVAKYCVN